MLILERPWTQQPQTVVGINWSKPLARDLAFCAPLGPAFGVRDMVTGQFGTKTGLASYAGGQNGAYPLFSTSNYVDFTNPVGISGTTPITIAWTQEPRASSLYSTVLQWKPTGASNTFLIYQSISDAAYYFVAGRQTGAAAAANFSANTGIVVNGRLDRFVLQLRGGTDSSDLGQTTLWRNGVAWIGSTAQTFGSSTASVFRVGATSAAGDPFEGLIGNLHIWRRVLSNSEAYDWTMNNKEFSVFPPRRIPIPTAAAAATAPTITALSAISITATSAQPQITYA